MNVTGTNGIGPATTVTVGNGKAIHWGSQDGTKCGAGAGKYVAVVHAEGATCKRCVKLMAAQVEIDHAAAIIEAQKLADNAEIVAADIAVDSEWHSVDNVQVFVTRVASHPFPRVSFRREDGSTGTLPLPMFLSYYSRAASVQPEAGATWVVLPTEPGAGSLVLVDEVRSGLVWYRRENGRGAKGVVTLVEFMRCLAPAGDSDVADVECPPVCEHDRTAEQGCHVDPCDFYSRDELDALHVVAAEHDELITFERAMYAKLRSEGDDHEEAWEGAYGCRNLDAPWGEPTEATRRYDELVRAHGSAVAPLGHF